jgi:transcriptional regulator GlxA family with amidase domain
MDAVTSSCGVAVQPNARLPGPTAFDYVVVVGGLIDEIPNLSPGLVRFLKDAAAARVPLVGVCTGAFILHRAGLMDGYRCCVSWFHHADFLEQFDGLTPVSDQIFIIDRDRLTCSGGASSAHLAAYLVEKHVGIAPARKSLQIMIIDEGAAGRGAAAGHPGGPRDDGRRRQEGAPPDASEHRDAVDHQRGRSSSRRKPTQSGASIREEPGKSPSDCCLSMRLDQAALLLNRSIRRSPPSRRRQEFCDTSALRTRLQEQHQGTTPERARQAPEGRTTNGTGSAGWRPRHRHEDGVGPAERQAAVGFRAR